MFDDALLESQRKRTGNGKGFSLPLAIGFHAVVIGAFVGASAWFTGEAPEPVIPVLFPAPASAPPPPLGGGEIHRTSAGSKPRPVQAMVQPVLLPVDQAKADPEDAREPQPGPADSGPDGTGLPTGVPDGTGPLSTDAVGADARDQIFTPGGDVRAPVLLERVEPDYPEPARRARLEGTVVLEAIITAMGSVEEIRLLRSINPLLGQAAERAVRQWRYRPATLNGRAVRVYLTVTVKFGITG